MLTNLLFSLSMFCHLGDVDIDFRNDRRRSLVEWICDNWDIVRSCFHNEEDDLSFPRKKSVLNRMNIPFSDLLVEDRWRETNQDLSSIYLEVPYLSKEERREWGSNAVAIRTMSSSSSSFVCRLGKKWVYSWVINRRRKEMIRCLWNSSGKSQRGRRISLTEVTDSHKVFSFLQRNRCEKTKGRKKRKKRTILARFEISLIVLQEHLSRQFLVKRFNRTSKSNAHWRTSTWFFRRWIWVQTIDVRGFSTQTILVFRRNHESFGLRTDSLYQAKRAVSRIHYCFWTLRFRTIALTLDSYPMSGQKRKRSQNYRNQQSKFLSLRYLWKKQPIDERISSQLEIFHVGFMLALSALILRLINGNHWQASGPTTVWRIDSSRRLLTMMIVLGQFFTS